MTASHDSDIDVVESSAADEQTLLRILLAEEKISQPTRRADEMPAPLSRSQRQLWYLQQVAPQSPAYNVFSGVRLSGSLDIEAFRAALDQLVRRHEILRTSFPAVDGRPIARVEAEPGLEIPVYDLSAVEPRLQGAEVASWCEREASRTFDLSCGPLLRIRLLRLNEAEHVALVTMHHIVTDAWSMGVLVDEIGQLYGARIHGRPWPLAQTMQYRDFAAWQETWLAGAQAEEQRRWWADRLAGVTPLQLPADRPRPPEPSYRGGVHSFHIAPDLAGAIRELGRREGATLFVTLLAAFAVLLHRYTGEEDIAIGTPVANRTRREFEGLIGFFVNTLVMRCDVARDPGFLALLRRVRDFTWGALAHQDLPFEDVIAAVGAERDFNNPLFQVMFALENAPSETLRLPGLALTPIEVEAPIAKFDLLLNMSEAADGGIGAAFQFATDLFDPASIAQMAGHFTMLLEAIAGNPQQPVGMLRLLTAAEQRRAVVAWNQTASPYPGDSTVQQLFEAQAERTPDACALAWGDERLSYGEFDRRANRMARHLRSAGAVEGSLVGLHLERSPAMIVATLAVLKAGCAYVPLDIAYPAERLAWMIADCGAPVVLSQKHLLGGLGAVEARIITLEDLHLQSDEGLQSHGGGEQPAYVIYTSGSTGVPKGVVVPHRAILRLVCNSDFVRLGAADRVAQASSASFDAATFEIWGALLNGGTLIGVERDVTLSPARLAEFLRAEKISTIFLTTALFNQIARERPDAFACVHHVLFGGEAVDPQWAREVLRAGKPARLLHVYGPTESTTFSTWHLVDYVPAEATTIPIGRSIANSQAYVLDRNLFPVPVGIRGELYVGGDGIALGYLSRPDLTAERFVSDPFSSRDGAKLYRTGDLCRYRHDGAIEFIGRLDNQVKLRGFRIELGEIESALTNLPGVREAVVLVREDQPGRRELLAYLVAHPGEQPEPETLRRRLSGRLPGYMVPSRYVVLPSLPLNQNGKVDRKALPAPADEPDRREVAEPRDPAEQALATVWRDVLGRPQLGIHDNYFESGGDSITAIQVVSRLRRFGWRLRVADLFRSPTIAQLAPCLTAEAEPRVEAEVPNEDEAIPLTAVQRWFFHHYRGDVNQFNQAVLLRRHEVLDERHLRAALKALLVRHDALRLRFSRQDGTVTQRCVPAGDPVALEIFDLTREPDPLAVMERHADAVQRSLDIERGPLLKAAVFRLADGDRLLLVIHHLAVDGVSWRILLEEFELACTQAAANQAIDLGPGSSGFRGWAQAMQVWARSQDLDRERAYWSEVENAAAARLPTAAAETPLLHGDAESVARAFSAEQTGQLLTGVHRAFGTEIMDLLLVALGRTLKRWSGGEQLRVSLEGHGREPPDEALDLSRTVGWFTSIYPFLLGVPGDDIGAQILDMKAALRRVPRKGIGYGNLRHVRGEQGSGPAPQLSFNYLGQFESQQDDSGDEPSGRTMGSHLVRAHELDMVGLVAGGRFMLSLDFDRRTLARETALSLLRDFEQELGAILRFCAARLDEVALAPSAPSVLPPDDAIEDSYPLSPMQEGLLFETLFDPERGSYFCQIRFQFTGALEREAFQQAWFALSQRHAILRSVFIHEDQVRPIQRVMKDLRPGVSFQDIAHLAGPDRAAFLDHYCREEQRSGFDLQCGPLMRVSVFREGQNAHYIVWSYHHILIDGWCLAILQRDFVELYASLREHRAARLPVAAPYRNYVHWLAAQDRDAARRFWRGYLDGYEHLATLPAVARNDHRPRSLAVETLELSADQSARLASVAAKAGVTLSAVMSGVWGLLLARYNNRSDVVFGSIVSGRPGELPGVEEMVGLFICAVPVRVTVGPDLRFRQLVRAVQDGALASLPHQHLPLPEIQSESALGRNLFDHLLVFENYPLRAVGTEAGEPVEFAAISAHDPTHYDLALTVVPGERTTVSFIYNLQVYGADQMRRMAAHLREAISSILDDPDRAVGDIAILPDAERDLLLAGFNDTQTETPHDALVHRLFEARAQAAPDAVALALGPRQLTYRELNARANRLARRLVAAGVGPDVPVGICLERSFELVVAVLGVLKAGGGYVPLDPVNPPQRLAFMLEDSGARVLVTDSRCAGLFEAGLATVLRLDGSQRADGEDGSNLDTAITAENLAYLIYTSGSTGQPKGCQIEHRNLTHYLGWAGRRYFPDGCGGSFGLFTSLSFDLTVTSLFLPLMHGRSLRIFPAATTLDEILRDYFDDAAGLDAIKLTPAHISLLATLDLPASKVQVAVVGGEQLLIEQVRCLRRLNPRMRIYNEYGPTETTVGCVVKEILPDEDRILIGRPIDNTRAYVLDRQLRPLPLAMPGELYIGGSGVARGYVNRAELTAEKFISDPFARGADARLYRTGDLVRWLPDGNMQYFGRLDDQVKIRGHRVELGEVERRLAQCESIEQAVVVAGDFGNGTDLAAYVVAAADWDFARTREELKNSVPDYMIPAFFVRLDRLPLTSNGKVDRRALPDPRTGSARSAPTVPPRTPTELALADLWRQVLQIEAIGARDDFFELGGHSLKAMQITAAIHKTLGTRVSLRQLFDNPTISGLAKLIDAAARSDWSHILPAPQRDHYELSHAQRRLWMLHQVDEAAAYNIPQASIIGADIDAEILNRAFQTLIARHETLRTAFIVVDGEPRQQVCATAPFALAQFDLRAAENAEQQARTIVDHDVNLPFDLAAPPLLRVSLARLAGDRSLLALTMHHIVGDGWSGNVLYRELLSLYGAYRHGRNDPLMPLRIQYKDFVYWQAARGFEREENYWLGQLSGMPERLALPYDFAPEMVRDFTGDTIFIELSAHVTAQLRRLALRRRTTLSNVVLALFELVLFHWTRQPDICIGMAVANRNHPDLEKLIGFFVNLLPIRCRLTSDMDFDELLDLTMERTQEALDHQDYPFDLMIQKLNPVRQANRQPLMNAVYGFQNFSDVHVDVALQPSSDPRQPDQALPQWDVFDFSFQTSKFDLTLFVTEERDALRFTFEFDTSLFLATTIQRQANALVQFAGLVTRTETGSESLDHDDAHRNEHRTA